MQAHPNVKSLPARFRSQAATRLALLCAAGLASFSTLQASSAPGTLASTAQGSQSQDTEPPSKALLHELCQHPRLAGTVSSRRAVHMVSRVLEDAGWQVTLDEREVLLSLPRRLSVKAFVDQGESSPFVSRLWTFDPDAVPTGDIPPFNAWTASGLAKGPLLDVGYGLRADFERLQTEQIAIKGSIAIARYGKGYRGIKLSLAEEFGCVGLLLFSDPKDDGAEKGATWPQGPWKPGHEAQRGSVGSLNGALGDPSTPGFPSPQPGRNVMEGQARVSEFALAQALPKIPCMPIGASDAQAMLSNLARVRLPDKDGKLRAEAIGPGPMIGELEVVAPRELRPIINIIAKLPGKLPTSVMAGNHRDAWVRGAHDAGSGTVSLLRAAQILGEKYSNGWEPDSTLFMGFWDAEEFGLIGSTEWVESHEGPLAQGLHLYINADALVSGQRFQASGTPGLEGFVAQTLQNMDLPAGVTTRPNWLDAKGQPKKLALPGSGSDFAPFLHRVGLPVLDLSFQGNSGGQYHTAYDDVSMVERYLDPGYVGHELAAHTLVALLMESSRLGRDVLDEVSASEQMADMLRDAAPWLGARHSQAIEKSFRSLASTISLVTQDKMPGALLPPSLYRSLLRPEGLPQRGWYRNALWSPNMETGYGSETLPVLRMCVAANSDGYLRFEVTRLIQEIQGLKSAWELVPVKSNNNNPAPKDPVLKEPGLMEDDR